MRRVLLTGSVSVVLAGLLTLLAAGPAAAHHGWEEYDTTTAYYVTGTVTGVRWGNPHPEVTIAIARPLSVPAGWAGLDIPAELEEIGGRQVLEATQPYAGGADQLHMDLAPVERLAAWGMEGEVEVGETIEAVGYIGRDDDSHMRPELIVLSDGQVVRQRSVPLPEAPGAGGGTEESAGASGQPTGGGTGSAAAEDDEGSAAGAVWALLAIGAVVIVGGGWYVVRRANQE